MGKSVRGGKISVEGFFFVVVVLFEVLSKCAASHAEKRLFISNGK